MSTLHPWEDLSSLKGFFTVGINRILEAFDPTVLIWLDADVTRLILPHLRHSRCIPFARDEIDNGSWNMLHPAGLLDGPDTFIDCKNSGVSATYWAMTLGCGPVYLLGMSATYDCRRGRTNLSPTHSQVPPSRYVGTCRGTTSGRAM